MASALKCQSSLPSIDQVVSAQSTFQVISNRIARPLHGLRDPRDLTQILRHPKGISVSKRNLQIQTCSVASPVASCNQHCLIPVGVALHLVACISRAFQPSQTTFKSIRVMSPRSSGPAPAEFGKLLYFSSLPMALMTCSAARCGLNHRKRVSEMNSAQNFSRIT